MAILGVRPNEYDLRISDTVKYLQCTGETTQVAQACTHDIYGRLDPYQGVQTWNDFVQAFPCPPTFGVANFWRLRRPQRWPWAQTLGVTSGSVVHQEGVVYDHWTPRVCRVMAIDSLSIVAHGLSHCLSLVHNEEETDNEFDVMRTQPLDLDWLKNSNKAVVRHHFGEPRPETPATGVLPAGVVQF